MAGVALPETCMRPGGGFCCSFRMSAVFRIQAITTARYSPGAEGYTDYPKLAEATE